MRELLVREVLSAAASSALSSSVPQSGGGTPLFRYDDGILSASSDSLYEMIAPAGRLLPRNVQISIGLNGELAATARQRIAE